MLLRNVLLLALSGWSLWGCCLPVESRASEPDAAEIYFFYDDTQPLDEQSRGAIRAAVESGFRIREIAANRFPNLAKRFQVRRFPSLILLRQQRQADRHEGRFTFARIREMFARARENRLERRERIREMLAGSGKVERDDAPSSIPPVAPRYIHTSTTSTEIDRSVERMVPKPLDRNGRFPVAHEAAPGEQRAFDATVRLRVIDPSGTSHGTGTIIHSQGNDALVLTCGHIFREAGGRGKIEADISFASRMTTVSGRLISYDANAHDIALLTIRTPYPVTAVRVARPEFRGQLNQEVFTIGCDKGNRPTIRRSHFKRAAIYDGTEKYDVFGRPIDGRSGGGLFNQAGELIGVCNAAAVHVDEGIYSGLRTIYHQLSVSHLVHLFNEAYWRATPEANDGGRMLAVADHAAANNSVVFQELPDNPALAFESSPAAAAVARRSSSAGDAVALAPPPARGWSSSASRSNQAVGSIGGNSTGMPATAQQEQPRIPAFSLSDRL